MPARPVADLLGALGWSQVDFVLCDAVGAEAAVFADPQAPWLRQLDVAMVHTHPGLVPGVEQTVAACFPPAFYDHGRHGEYDLFQRRVPLRAYPPAPPRLQADPRRTRARAAAAAGSGAGALGVLHLRRKILPAAPEHAGPAAARAPSFRSCWPARRDSPPRCTMPARPLRRWCSRWCWSGRTAAKWLRAEHVVARARAGGLVGAPARPDRPAQSGAADRHGGRGRQQQQRLGPLAGAGAQLRPAACRVRDHAKARTAAGLAGA